MLVANVDPTDEAADQALVSTLCAVDLATVAALGGIGSMDQVSPVTISNVDLAALFQKHKTHLLHFVQRYVSSWDDAEDVVQNTFVEAARCAHRFSGLSKPSTWLFGIALNLARSQVRQNGADRYDTVEDDFMEQLVDIHADPAKIFEIRQLASKVDAMLCALPLKIRTTFIAVLDGEMTYDEAAAELNIPVGTVRSRVARVRASARAECDRD